MFDVLMIQILERSCLPSIMLQVEDTGSESEIDSVENRPPNVVAYFTQGCGAIFGEDSHEECTTHTPCSSRGVYAPMECSVCKPRIDALLKFPYAEHKKHPMVKLLKHQWEVVQKTTGHHSRTTSMLEDATLAVPKQPKQPITPPQPKQPELTMNSAEVQFMTTGVFGGTSEGLEKRGFAPQGVQVGITYEFLIPLWCW